MPIGRRVFFSFHYEQDAWRAAQVRNSQLFPVKGALGRFNDAVDWEQVKRQGDTAIRSWIMGQLSGTSVTVVLIGTLTSNRDWVDYEIQQSTLKNPPNGLLGVYIHNIRNEHKHTSLQGQIPRRLKTHNRTVYVFDWVSENGRANLGNWIEQAWNDSRG